MARRATAQNAAAMSGASSNFAVTTAAAVRAPPAAASTAVGLLSPAAAARLAPGVWEMPFWQAVALASSGKLSEALPIFKQVFAAEPFWKRLVPRLADVEQLPKDPTLLKAIQAQ